MPKETLKEGCMKHVSCIDKEHILEDTETGKLEVWFSNKNHASYGLIYKNTHLEFARSATIQDLERHDIRNVAYNSNNLFWYILKETKHDAMD